MKHAEEEPGTLAMASPIDSVFAKCICSAAFLPSGWRTSMGGQISCIFSSRDKQVRFGFSGLSFILHRFPCPCLHSLPGSEITEVNAMHSVSFLFRLYSPVSFFFFC